MHDTDTPVLRAAGVNVTMTSPVSCDVVMHLTIDGAGEIDHRLDATRFELREVAGAQQVGGVRTIGRTQSLLLRPGPASAQRPLEGGYQIRYRAELPEGREFRCPLWLPAVPADGRSRAVSLSVDLPAGTQPSDSMPALTFADTHGETTLGHLPAFVHVRFAPPGAGPAWSVARTMDAVALTVILGASAIWVWWRRR
jgi:hypothetical protein